MEALGRPYSPAASARSTWRAWLAATVIIGGLHESEHVLQVIQIYVLGDTRGRGLLGSAFDIEPVHFVYNGAYLLFLVGLALIIHRERRVPQAVSRLLTVALLLQCWHVVEHVAKIAQYLVLNHVNGTGGVFGAGPGGLVPLFPVPLLHFTYNTLVYLPVVVAALRLRHRT